MAWVSVKDRLPIVENKPHDHAWCLVFLTDGDIKIHPYNVYHLCWDDEGGDDYFCDAVSGKITHWMPLPDAPKS